MKRTLARAVFMLVAFWAIYEVGKMKGALETIRTIDECCEIILKMSPQSIKKMVA